jgi:hypothetical protein
MKKLILISILCFLFRLLPAPGFTETVILRPEPIYIYNISDPFTRAIFAYESRFKTDAVNKISGASGIGQITHSMIKEVNRILKLQGESKRYSFKDVFDPFKTHEIWCIVQDFHNPEYCYDKACRIWFGTGKQHDGMRWEDYYNEVMEIYYLSN